MDQQALNLAKAIRRTETGGHKDPYNARGASGEFGAFQFMPATYKVLAQKHLGDANAAPTVENQNKIVYSEVKSLKDQGYNPAQIASIWNSGKPDKYKSGGIGVNKYGVNYNVPDYVKKVSQAYRDISGSVQAPVEQVAPVPTIEDEKTALQEQGQPISVGTKRAQPTVGGNILRGALKPFVSAATTVLPVARGIKDLVDGGGTKPVEEIYAPVKTKYLGDVYSPGAKGIIQLDKAQNVGDVFKGATRATTDIAGKGLEIGSYAMAPGAVGSLKTLPAIGRTALEGAKIGFTGGLGTGLQSASEQTNVGQALKDVAFQAGGGALAGGVLGGATTGLIKGVSGIKNVIKPSEKAVSDAINSLEKTYTDISSKTKTGEKKLSKIISKTESMNKAGTEGVTPMRKLAEDGIVPNTKGTRLDTFQQAQDYRAKVEPLYEVNKKALQEVGLSTAPVQLSDLEQGALEYAKTPENINSGRYAKMASEIKSEFNLLRENYPDGVVPLNVVDDIKSARWSNVFKNKGFIESDILKKDSEYAIAKSLQKTIERIAEDAGHADVAQLNREIGSILDASKFLESLNGETLKGGRVGKYVGTLIGSTIGNSLPAKIVGALGGNVVADILIKSDVQSPVRRLILSKLEQSSPKAYEATLKWLAEQDALRMTRLQLPAPKNVGPIVNQGRPIQVAPTGSTAEYLGKDVVAQSKSPLNQQTVAATNNVTNTSISTELPKAKTKSSDLSTEAKKYKSAEEFVKAFTQDMKRGQYWHITEDPNFKIDLSKGPRDMSSISGGGIDVGKLMVTSDLPYWAENYKGSRKYVAKIDMSNVPNSDFWQTERGMGNEFFVNLPEKARVEKVIPLEQGLKESVKFKKWLEKNITNKSQLEEIWNKENKSPLPKSKVKSSDLSIGKKGIIGKAIDTIKTLKDKNVRERGSISLESILPERKPKGNQGVSLPNNTIYKETGNLTTKILKDLEGKTTVSKQYILDATNRPELKQVERDLTRQILDTMPGKDVNVKEFADKVKSELLPLTVRNQKVTVSQAKTQLKNMGYTIEKEMDGGASILDRNGDFVEYDEMTPEAQRLVDRVFGTAETYDQIGGNKYENIALPDDIRGNVKNYKENIYESPIKTSAGSTHFSGQTDNYFGHTRIEDMADNKTRRVIEVQSDLYQKGNLERENPTALFDKKELKNPKDKEAIARMNKANEQIKTRQSEVAKLQQYNDPTAHFRMIREEIKKAAQDGKTKLQFPTGETAMKIEGLGENARWFDPSSRRGVFPSVSAPQLKVGKEITTRNSIATDLESDIWIITDVLGDGKFKAVPKDRLDDLMENAGIASDTIEPNDAIAYAERHISDFNRNMETFDISGKVDTNNPIYKFYEKDVAKYLQKFDGKRVKDSKGIEWIEVHIKKEYGKLPVEAFALAGLTALPAGMAMFPKKKE